MQVVNHLLIMNTQTPNRIFEARCSIRTSKLKWSMRVNALSYLPPVSTRLTESAVTVYDVCVVTRVDGSRPSRRPPAPPPRVWGGHQGPLVCREQGEQGGIDGAGLNGSTSGRRSTRSSVWSDPPVALWNQTHIHNCPRFSFHIQIASSGGDEDQIFICSLLKNTFVCLLLKSESGWQRGGCSSSRRAYSD